MGYRDYLWRMLQPLGVYTDGGFNGGELAALGAALDQAEQQLSDIWREITVISAERDGLSQAEQLFPMIAGTETEGRREALKKLWQTDNRSFSRSDIMETLEGCGLSVTVGAVGDTFEALVIFQNPLTIWDEPVFLFWLLEQVLPCHMAVTTRFTYVDINSGETVQERRTLEIMRQRTQAQWEQLLGAYI